MTIQTSKCLITAKSCLEARYFFIHNYYTLLVEDFFRGEAGGKQDCGQAATRMVTGAGESYLDLF
jgi:hypothetical protein